MGKIKDILCLHHSHLDIGYTHPQPLLLELQRDYIDEAIALCLKTADFPEESRFRWTCEATYPVLKWLETASSKDIETFQYLLKNGQISLTAMMMHTTPLCTSEEMIRLLQPVRELRKRFDVPINTAINHDVNGQPWPMSQILLDAGIDFYITGINIHFGGIPMKRPSVFNWETPDKRKLLTYLGEHYSLFSQFFHTSESSTKLMDQGIQEYVDRLEQSGYEHDFIYLTSTNPPLFDNNCPDPNLASLIRQYNDEGHEYRIQFVTPEMLLERVTTSINQADIPTHSGDWTDYWNFGSGSSAKETRLNRRTKIVLQKADLLESLQGSPGLHYDKVKNESFMHVALFDEHTWGAAHSITNPNHPEVESQRIHKSHMAYQAADLSGYVLGKQMEKIADNPLQSTEPEGLILVNTSSIPQRVELKLPQDYFTKGRHLAAARVKQYLPYGKEGIDTQHYGTVDMPPFSWRKIPFENLKVQNDDPQEKYTVTENTIETPYYRLTFNPVTGRVIQLFDKNRNWPILDESSEWTLFEFVRETINPLKNPEERATFFPRDVDLGNKSISVWNHHWEGNRTGANQITSWDIEKKSDNVSFIMKIDAPGVRGLKQRITFSVHHPRIELFAEFDKEDVRQPESIYFAFPLNLNKGWRSYFDTAGMFVELDQEQLGAVSRDWVTVDQTVSIYDQQRGITLACPDAPLVQIGDFNFGKESKSIERKEKPILLAWPMNNYWDTNFWISQPGHIQFKYELCPFDQFEPKEAYKVGIEASNAIEMNVAVHCPQEESGQLFNGSDGNIVPLYIKPSDDKNEIIVTLRNLAEEPDEYSFNVPGRTIVSSYIVNVLDEKLNDIQLQDGKVNILLKGKQLIQIHLVLEK